MWNKSTKRVNCSEWAANAFMISKKDKTVRFITNLRELSKRIKRKLYLLPNIRGVLHKLEKFTNGTTLYFNMRYYHIELDVKSQRLCAIILPWGEYEYQRLLMGLCNSLKIFKENVNSLLSGRAYVDDVFCIITKSWDNHLTKLKQTTKNYQKQD